MQYILITLLLVICAVIYIKIASKLNIVDNPNFRSSHTIPTIRGGGILFFIAVIAFFVSSQFQYPYFVAGLSLAAILSFLDDIYTLSAKIRLPFQFIAIGLVLYQLQLFDAPLIWIVIAAIVGVGFINLFNFMDGINGITGLYSMAVLVGVWLINSTAQIIEPDLISYVFLSIVVFGYYNFRKKARMFAGDVGSISLAMLLFFVGLHLGLSLQAPVILLLVSVYGVDGVLTILFRISIKEHIMEAHRHHIYQKLVDVWKWSHLKVSAIYALLQLAIGFLVFYTYKFTFSTQILIILSVLTLLSLGYVYVFKKTKEKVIK
ncbi:glycosyltransferase family 4 protein [Lutibacter sp. HS1-25]|uniref:MraY family glycosyltransferase n=1 Tax=Lutibacter sp. HS1-25 TaxID=2485000 RepID=UPI001011EB10|nr:glycosyltransferase family 4 protein [Lutibacter sp. HS1-25]RXP52229.1 glycosyltransferase family 4 protein [Lutibacter sp. HS1-25]